MRLFTIMDTVISGNNKSIQEKKGKSTNKVKYQKIEEAIFQAILNIYAHVTKNEHKYTFKKI
ncbi:hypothetical protein HMPREF0061_0856 [Aerococcus viridans ATCC 11563 = CCUG 4311]|uniref:Uncharacterized protein n=2 Tax=Aerococcus viridans TaxID=1377 RepID=A0ABN0A956_AERVM|nr:hypothetical protein HMPREF0061_0856 [Aerococcus viridans ATCC 11563 = CCUG 4311]